MSDSSSFLSSLLLPVWLLCGYVLGRLQERVGNGLIWAVVFGPLGVLLFALGTRSRRRVEADRPVPRSEEIGVGSIINVYVDGQPRMGTIESWRQSGEVTETLVRYLADNGSAVAQWFGPEHVRLP